MFKALDARWYLGICPNGWKTKGAAHLCIYCQSIDGDDEKELSVNYLAEIASLDYYDINFEQNIIKKKGSCITAKSPFKWNQIQNEKEIVITIKLWRHNSIQKNEARVLSQMYLEKMKREKENNHDEQRKINQLNEEIIALKRGNEAMDKKEKEATMKNLKQQQQIMKLQKEMANLTDANEMIAIKKVKSFESQQETKMNEDTKEKQNEMDAKLRTEENRLNEWDLDCIKIKNEARCDEDDDDEKEKEKQNMNKLLNRYILCNELWDKQENRMENIVIHCTTLNKMKKALKKESAESHETSKKMNEKYNDMNIKYENMKSERIKCQKEWKVALEKFNESISAENKTNKVKHEAFCELNVCNLESQKWDTLNSKCVDLLKKYQLFDKENEENIKATKEMFNNLWEKAMKNWHQWTANDVICWFKYLQIKHELILSKDINFDFVLKEMIESKMSGASFKCVDKSDLKSVGITRFDDRQQIYSKIKELVARYPQLNDDNDDGDNELEGHQSNIRIPKEFLCPITKRIMKEPVKIFDNNTYEKEAIIKYLTEFNKSPITEEQCDDDGDHWTIPDRKLMQKISIFLSVNDISSNLANEGNQTSLLK